MGSCIPFLGGKAKVGHHTRVSHSAMLVSAMEPGTFVVDFDCGALPAERTALAHFYLFASLLSPCNPLRFQRGIPPAGLALVVQSAVHHLIKGATAFCIRHERSSFLADDPEGATGTASCACFIQNDGEIPLLA